MKKITKLLICVLIPLICFGNSIGEDNNGFAFALYSQFEDSEANIAISPYGIFSNLALLYFGAQGDTAQQIKNALHLSATGDKFLAAFQKHQQGLMKKAEFGYELSIANALFPHQGTHFLTAFKDLATQAFDAKLQSIDYEVPDSAVETINTWISEKTGGKINQLVSENEINKLTRLVVANAVYFQGNWVYPFDKGQGVFYPESGLRENVDTLKLLRPIPYYETKDFQAVAFPFRRIGTLQPFLECLLVLPKNNTSLSEIEKSLSPKQLDKILYSLEPAPVNAEVPKFCFSIKLELNDQLQKLGIKDAFNYGADFSKIDGMRDLFLNTVLHQTYFSFHEEGVTAAAATTSHLGLKSMPPPTEKAKDFIADHPFLFFIVDYHSRAILFMGRVANPTTDGCE